VDAGPDASGGSGGTTGYGGMLPAYGPAPFDAGNDAG
jgi:hypothetical protein